MSQAGADAPVRRDAAPGRRVAFVPREPPLVPVAAAAVGACSGKLGERLLALPDSHLGRLRGIAGPDFLLVLGETADLPWVPGIAYLGHDPAAPRLLLPTAEQPDVPADLFEYALFGRLPKTPAPLAVLARPRRVFPVTAARRIERALLRDWQSRWA